MFKLMLLIAGINASPVEVEEKESSSTISPERIEFQLVEELDHFQFIAERAEQVTVDSQVDDNGGALKCVEANTSVIWMLQESVDFEYGSAKRAIHRQRLELAEFHLLQLTEVVDKAQAKLSDAEECVATIYANAN